MIRLSYYEDIGDIRSVEKLIPGINKNDFYSDIVSDMRDNYDKLNSTQVRQISEFVEAYYIDEVEPIIIKKDTDDEKEKLHDELLKEGLLHGTKICPVFKSKLRKAYLIANNISDSKYIIMKNEIETEILHLTLRLIENKKISIDNLKFPALYKMLPNRIFSGTQKEHDFLEGEFTSNTVSFKKGLSEGEKNRCYKKDERRKYSCRRISKMAL
jgi:hypothetical protein